jgi:hypothetical protein
MGVVIKLRGNFSQGGVKPGAPAKVVNSFEAACRNKPGPGIGRYAISRPLGHGYGEGVVERLLRQVEVTKEANQGCQDAARLGAVKGLYLRLQRSTEVFGQ